VIEVASAPLDADLSDFSRLLWRRGIPHRISEEQGKQIIYMEDARYQPQIQAILQRYLSEPEFQREIRQRLSEESEAEFVSRSTLYPRATPAQAPVLFMFVAISVVIALLTQFGQGGPLMRGLLILDPFQLDFDLNDFEGRWSGLAAMISSGQVWRLITPDFLHFNLMHIVFNLLMMWVLGGQLELRKGSFGFLTFAVFVSIVSNVAQLLDGGYLFGGLSGVVYGLVGYCWLWKRHQPDVFFPDALLRFSLVWLLIGYTPLTEWMGIGRMANSAHLYGLLAGLFWGWVTTANFRSKA